MENDDSGLETPDLVRWCETAKITGALGSVHMDIEQAWKSGETGKR
jgi:hypothetical protein